MSDEIRALLDAAAQTHPDTCLCHNCARQLRAALATVTAERDGLRHNWHQAVQDGVTITEMLATVTAERDALDAKAHTTRQHLDAARALKHEAERALATVAAERDRIHREADHLRQGHQTLVASQADDRQRLATERDAHEETRAIGRNQLRKLADQHDALASTRAALAKAEARVAELESTVKCLEMNLRHV